MSAPDRAESVSPCETVTGMADDTLDTAALRARVEEHIRAHDLIQPREAVVALVSGGADSTCLWHALRGLGYRVSALHVNHGLRGAESDEDARYCRDVLGAKVVDGRGGTTEDELRRIRYSFAADHLRATGHTASDQVETVLYRLVSSGARTASSVPFCRSGARRPPRTAKQKASPTAPTARTRRRAAD